MNFHSRRKCDKSRFISLTSHALKGFLRVVHTSLYKRCEERIGNTQFDSGVEWTAANPFLWFVLLYKDVVIWMFLIRIYHGLLYGVCVRLEQPLEVLKKADVDSRGLLTHHKSIALEPDCWGERGLYKIRGNSDYDRSQTGMHFIFPPFQSVFRRDIQGDLECRDGKIKMNAITIRLITFVMLMSA